MRVLVFNPSYPPVPCGVGDYTRGLATAIAAAGHDVAVVTESRAAGADAGGPRVLPVLADWSALAFLRAWPRFARPRPQLVVSGFPSVLRGRHARLLYLLPGLAKAFLGWPRTTFIVHEFVRTGERERRLLRVALRAADRVVAVTEAERDALVARYPWSAARTVVRHNAPSIAATAPDPSADAAVRAMVGQDERPLIAFFGFVWSPAKGFEELLEALARTDAVLAASGSLDLSNPYHARLAARIEELGLQTRVRWLGFLADEDAGRLLRVADAVVLPFRGGAESGYTSLLAALVNGAAVITTRGTQNPPWLRDGEAALLVEPGDPHALADAIRRLLGDEQLAARVRAGARSLSFGWQEIVDAVLAPARVSSPAA